MTWRCSVQFGRHGHNTWVPPKGSGATALSSQFSGPSAPPSALFWAGPTPRAQSAPHWQTHAAIIKMPHIATTSTVYKAPCRCRFGEGNWGWRDELTGLRRPVCWEHTQPGPGGIRWLRSALLGLVHWSTHTSCFFLLWFYVLLGFVLKKHPLHWCFENYHNPLRRGLSYRYWSLSPVTVWLMFH